MLRSGLQLMLCLFHQQLSDCSILSICNLQSFASGLYGAHVHCMYPKLHTTQHCRYGVGHLHSCACIMKATARRKEHRIVMLLQDFADTTAPALTPIFQSAKGETLLLLIRNTPTMLKCMPRNYVTSMLVPLFAKAADQGYHRRPACNHVQYS